MEGHDLMSLLWTQAGIDYISHHELAEMHSGDFDEPMKHVMRGLRQDWRDYKENSAGDEGHDPDDYGVHAKDVEHGGPDNYVAHLVKDMAANGMREPIEVRGGNVVTEGHHRGAAALQLKMDKIPVRHIR